MIFAYWVIQPGPGYAQASSVIPSLSELNEFLKPVYYQDYIF